MGHVEENMPILSHTNEVIVAYVATWTRLSDCVGARGVVSFESAGG